MANNNRTLLYVGVGCGALALFGMCIGSAAAGYFFWSKTRGSGAIAQVGSEEPPAPTPPAYRPIAGDGYTFDVPSEWIEASVPKPLLIGERAPTRTGGVFTNINLVNEPFGGDAQAYTAANIQQIQLGGSVVVAQRPATVGSHEAMDVESILSSTVPPTRMLQRYTTANGMGWVMTCTGPKAGFDRVRPKCTTILDTLRLGH